MAAYTNVPTLEANFLAPASVSVDVMGSSVSGGRNANGESQTIEMSGGGLLAATYSDCKLTEPEQYEYVNYLGARFNGGFRFLNVPIISDWYGPFAGKRPVIGGIRHKAPQAPTTSLISWDGASGVQDLSWDTGEGGSQPLQWDLEGRIDVSLGAIFSDTSGYSQASVWGEITAAANLNAGIIKMRVYGLSRPLRWSDWFSIHHDNKGWRAYRYWDVLNVTDEVDPVYTLALSPPLREAVTVGTRVEFARPRFVAKFKDGFTLPSISEAFYAIQQTIQFSEAF